MPTVEPISGYLSTTIFSKFYFLETFPNGNCPFPNGNCLTASVVGDSGTHPRASVGPALAASLCPSDALI